MTQTSLPFPSSGLYVITAEGTVDPQDLALRVRAALQGGAQVVQYRAKSPRNREAEARLLLEECRRFQVPLIINDDWELALAIGADGVHLGRDDAAPGELRERKGPSLIIGVSCYDSVVRAVEAQALGASYVAFGRFFPSSSKPHAPCAHLETLREAKRRLKIPIVAIGGITEHNGGSLIDAGADLLAVIDAVLGQADPETAARGFQRLFQ